MSYNLKTVASLCQEGAVTISVVHDDGGKHYKYKCLAALAETLELKDKVVVLNKTGFTVGRVVKIDTELDVDLSSSINYRWAFQRVNEELAAALEDMDDKVVNILQNAQREQAKQAALEALGVSSQELQVLSADMGQQLKALADKNQK